MTRFGLVLLLLLSLVGGPMGAQAPDKEPTLTDVQRLTLTTKIQAAQMAGQAATPKAMADAIADLIAQRQQAAQQAANDASVYYTGLAKEGYTLNAQTMVYEKKPGK